MRFPCVHATATTPVQRLEALFGSIRPGVSDFPDAVPGSSCTSTFSRPAQRSLALPPAHSRASPNRDALSEGFRHFVTSMPAPVASGWSGCWAGLAPAGEAPPSHGARGKRPFEAGSPREGIVRLPSLVRLLPRSGEFRLGSSRGVTQGGATASWDVSVNAVDDSSPVWRQARTGRTPATETKLARAR